VAVIFGEDECSASGFRFTYNPPFSSSPTSAHQNPPSPFSPGKAASGVERAMVLLLPPVLSALAFTALSPLIGEVSAKHLDRNHIQSLRNKAAEKLSKNRLAVVPGGDVIDVKVNAGVKNITFSNPAASGESLSLSCAPRSVAVLIHA
jgi:hypothetical protein